MRQSFIALAVAAATMAGCTSHHPQPRDPGAGVYSVSASVGASWSAAGAAVAGEILLKNVDGREIGSARLTGTSTGGVSLRVDANGLTPGLHGMHLHEVGVCDPSTAPPFASAGGHFNPGGREHGARNPNGRHAGDLPNLEVDAAGVGAFSGVVEGLDLQALLDHDGAALVLHEREDDLSTDSGPAGPGNSGARVACGVIQAR